VPDSSLSLRELRDRWNEAGRADPFWAVLSWGDKTSNRWTPEEFFQTGVEEIRGVMADVKAVDPSLATERALDFGCGPGRLTQALATDFESVDGVDISPSMIELANRLNQHPDRCRYHLNVADDLALFADSTFDFVYSNITLQHVGQAHAKSYLREFFRVLKPVGVTVFQLPGRRTRMRSRIKALLPAAVLAAYHRARYRGHPAAVVEGIARDHLIAYVTGLGGELLGVCPNQSAGAGWESFRYTFRKTRVTVPQATGSPDGASTDVS